MTKKQQSKYIESLQRECQAYYNENMSLRDALCQYERKIRALENELSRAKLERAMLQEQYMRGESE